ncbi:MAG: hypothetical protein NTY02_13645 [Acidobacteria bacterium]|nr:hypothetical protein [Acidobacteriota bacterium]
MSHRLWVILALILAVAAVATPGATTVIPPTFSEMVAQAQIVFVGETVDVQSRWIATRSGPAIVTTVTFKVERTLKGELGVATSLEFLGGTVGEDRLEVSGMPRFRVGDRDVLFVDERGRPMSPVVGFMHGRFRVLHDPATSRESIARYNYEPLAGVSDIGAAVAPPRVASARALTLRAFEDEITQAVRRLPARE